MAASDELDVVRWVSAADAGDLMGDLHEPINQYLRRLLCPPRGNEWAPLEYGDA
jgi:hypothetical protein